MIDYNRHANKYRLYDIIRNRTVGIVLLGKSIETLEQRIEEYKDYDICWSSLNLFTPVEDYILSKIGKQLEFVYDSCTIPQPLFFDYENSHRLPRMEKYLARENNIWITSYGMIRDSVIPIKGHWYEQNRHKIMIVDGLFPQNIRGDMMSVPNSATLMLASAIAAQAKNIIIFGMDGYAKDSETYFKPELIRKERLLTVGSEVDTRINSDTDRFKQDIPKLINTYKHLFNNLDAKIYNCSKNSVYEMFPKIDYDQLKDIL